MHKHKLFSLFVALSITALLSVFALAQTKPAPAKPAQPAPAPAPQTGAKPKPPTKDEVYFTLARRINEKTNQAVSGMVGALDGVIEVKAIELTPEGKAMVTVQERAASNAAYTQKSARLVFIPAGEKWHWDQFEEARRFYPVDRLFSYTQSEIGKKHQAINASWTAFTAALTRQAEAAVKALETVKSVLRAEPAALSTAVNNRTALTEAMKGTDQDAVVNVYRQLRDNNDPITTLADQYTDLKANDAYLRLIEEYKTAISNTDATRKNYVEMVRIYNEALERLPFALVAAGLEFVNITPRVEGQ